MKRTYYRETFRPNQVKYHHNHSHNENNHFIMYFNLWFYFRSCGGLVSRKTGVSKTKTFEDILFTLYEQYCTDWFSHSELVLQCTYLLSLDVLKRIVVAMLLLVRLTVLALKFNPADVQKIMWKPHVICPMCNHQSYRSISSFKPNNSGWQKVHLLQ